MPRQPKCKSEREHWTIQQWRAYNYQANYERRAYVQALPKDQRTKYARYAAALPCPTLNPWGVGEYTREQEQFIFKVNLGARLDVWYLNPWYCTEEGWQDFQDQWANLPEPVGIRIVEWEEVVHTRLGTKAKDVPNVHKPD